MASFITLNRYLLTGICVSIRNKPNLNLPKVRKIGLDQCIDYSVDLEQVIHGILFNFKHNTLDVYMGMCVYLSMHVYSHHQRLTLGVY